MKCVWVTILFLIVSIASRGQLNNERCRWLSVFNEPVLIDSLTVVPGSVSFSDQINGRVEYDRLTGRVTLSTAEPRDPIRICYRVFPYDLYQTVSNRTPEEEKDSAVIVQENPVSVQVRDSKEELFPTERINKSGAISRGISFGNRQDIFVNSVLNLQMEGALSDNLNIRASITDQNIPYQPEGNTLLVQDFDNVFFEIYNNTFSAKAGDIVLKNIKSEFLRFQRNVQGASLQTIYSPFSGSEAVSTMAYSVSKGKFSSYQLEVIDGVMGPYKIYGPNNEAFITVIANSERVYLDGKPLVRGYDNDYLIDYNTAEITFTSRILITKYSRVVIDFVYTNQSYSRSVFNFSHVQKIKKHEISIQYYREKDNRNQPLSFQLNDEDKLAMTDPSISGEAEIPGWDSTGFRQDRVLYKKTDTISSGGERVEIFKASSNPDSAVYEVSFSEVGWGKGDYIRKQTSLNGNVFEWTGIKEGNFLPVRMVPLPAARQMVSVRSDVRMGEHAVIFNEMAFSSVNHNLFSRPPENRVGLAIKSGMAVRDSEVTWLPGYTFSGQLDAEFDNRDFTAIDRFRDVEYDRNWSYDQQKDSLVSSDRIFNLSASLKKDMLNHFDVFISRRDRAGAINGWQGKIGAGFDSRHVNFSADLFMMKNDNGIQSSRWLRYYLKGYLKTKYLFPGYQYSVDHNLISPQFSDSIVSTAMNYDEHLFFINSNDSLKTSFSLDYSIRKDRIPQYGEMKDHNLARTTRLAIAVPRGKFGKFDLSVIYRQLEYLEDTINQPENSLLGRAGWSISLFSGHVKSETSYAIGNSRELQREYLYIAVPTGEGTHTWRDNNGDGIQDLSEFYLAINPDERNFIKLFMPTDDYVLAYDNHLNHRISIEMPRSWRNASGFKNILARFSVSTFANIRQKINQDDFWENLLFAGSRENPERLISFRKNIRNMVQFNRADPRYGIDLVHLLTSNRQLISGGFEERANRQLKLVSRFNFRRMYNLRINLVRSLSSSNSDFLEGRNFQVTGNRIAASFEWQPSNFWRFTGDYSFTRNADSPENERPDGESKLNESSLNIKYARATGRNFDFTLRYIHIDFTGEENTALGYELLEGLKPGNNLTWSLIWQQKLLNGLQLSINYEGRKSGELEVAHIGRMQVTALF